MPQPISGVNSILSDRAPIAADSPLAKMLGSVPPTPGIASLAVRGIAQWVAGRRTRNLRINLTTTAVVMAPQDAEGLRIEEGYSAVSTPEDGDVRIFGLPVIFDPTVPLGTIRIRTEETIVLPQEHHPEGTQK